MMPAPALNNVQLRQCLDDALGWILPKQRDLAGVAEALAQHPQAQQAWVLEWIQILIPHSVEITYQFLSHVSHALQVMDEAGVEAWLRAGLECFETQGLNPAITHLQAVAVYAEHHRKNTQGLALVSVQRVLQTFLMGLGGRALTIQTADAAYTDTENVYLPAAMNCSATHNFFVYKATAAHLWAQIHFGTWQIIKPHPCTRFADPAKAFALFHVLERLRLDAVIARQFAGLDRDILSLLAHLGEPHIPAGWEKLAAELANRCATVHDSYRLLIQVFTWDVPPPVCYQGVLLPDAVEKTLFARVQREQQHMTEWQARTDISVELPASPQTAETQPEIKLQPDPPKHLMIDGQAMPLSPEMQKVVAAVVHDQGDIPDTYFLGIGGRGETTETPLAPPLNSAPENPIFTYPEWDYRRKSYHQDHCYLREIPIEPQADDFVEKTLLNYRGLLKKLRQVFELLRGENCWLKRQQDGEEIDLDALVMAHVDAQRAGEMSQQVFAKWRPQQRNIAVMFMVDMSGSTKGQINLAERESLVLLCEVLEILGDRYAIYGFSGSTRKRCEVYPIKRFGEPYNQLVKQRISGIKPQAYTRMGVTIRHLSKLLQQTEASIKLLITLSDGKPDDEGDNYRGYYGIEDTRQALLETKHAGIHTFCITIDSAARSYLPHLYGAVNYTVIDKVAQLPLKLYDIYRKLTT